MLTAENYFSQEMLMKYLSASQYKDFAGTMGKPGCESLAMAKLRGEWQQEMTIPLMVGKYVDSHFEGTLSVFKAQNPDIICKTGKNIGQLKSDYIKANDIINKIEKSEYFMKYMSGQKQVVMTGKFFGAEWKCKIDSLPSQCIVDLKIMKSLKDSFWVKDYGKMSFVHYWGYDIQGMIYQRIVECNTNKRIPFYIAGASKEKITDIEIIGFTQKDLDDTASIVEGNVSRILKLKSGEVEPERCGKCDYCVSTKVLSRPIHFSELF